MVKQTPEELRSLVLAEDRKKDISFSTAAVVGVVSSLSFFAAIGAIIMNRALEYFRADASAYWLSCVPFLFPAATGVFVAYKKQFGYLAVHLMVSLLALMMGGFGFGLSVEPIFIYRENCRRNEPEVPCQKDSLAYLYIIFGGLAVVMAVANLIITVAAIQLSQVRIAKRLCEEEVVHQQEYEQKQRELRRMKSIEHSTLGLKEPLVFSNGVQIMSPHREMSPLKHYPSLPSHPPSKTTNPDSHQVVNEKDKPSGNIDTRL